MMTLEAKHYAGKTWKGLAFGNDGICQVQKVPENLLKIIEKFGIKVKEPSLSSEPDTAQKKK